MTKPILIVDDERSFQELYENKLHASGFDTVTASNAEEAFELLKKNDFSMVVSDIRMPGQNGIWLLTETRKIHADLPFLLITAFANVRDAVNSLKLGAVDYLEKPIDLDELTIAVRDNLNISSFSITKEAGIPQKALDGIVAESVEIQQLFADAYHVAQSDATILITGESGTGKDVLATFIHKNSKRGKKPFIALNCAAIPANMLGSELFGHERGAFTGAINKRSGRFREANEGTLFLDEIGDMSLELQPSLLRAIENNKITPLGSDFELPIDIRLIAATNKKLLEEVKNGNFREDLFYRLHVIEFEVLPLRERLEDILPLAKFFLKQSGQSKRLSAAAARMIQSYSWPGNVRELANAMQRANIIARTDMIMPEHLPPGLKKFSSDLQPSISTLKTLRQQENESIRIALEKTNGNQTKAAELLGISRRTFINKLKRENL